MLNNIEAVSIDTASINFLVENFANIVYNDFVRICCAKWEKINISTRLKRDKLWNNRETR